MMSLWDALRMNMMISYQELVRTFPKTYCQLSLYYLIFYYIFFFKVNLAVFHQA